MNFDRIIVSSNEDPRHLEFWPRIAATWRTMLDVPAHLALLTQRAEDDEVIQHLRLFGKVTLFKPQPGIPETNQAQVLRFILAANQPPNEVLFISDIDLLPLDREQLIGVIANRPQGHLLYGDKFLNAEAVVFKAVINPLNLPYDELLQSWTGKFDHIKSLIRYLLSINPVPCWQAIPITQ